MNKKNAITTIAAVVLLFSLSACSKNYCLKCVSTTQVSGGGSPSVGEAISCGLSKKEARDGEGTTTASSTSGSVTATITTVCSSTKE